MRRLITLLTLCSSAGCGLADNPRDEANRYEYIRLTDPAFEAWCLREADTDGDGRISRYEAQRIRRIDCRGCGIASLWEIGEFSRLESLDCSGNDLEELRLGACPLLQRVDCSSNRLVALDIQGLRSLTELNCSQNRLARLDVETNAALQTLRCTANPLTALDVSACAQTMELVDATACPLGIFYRGAGQTIRSLALDDPTIVAER